jgi:hypothetical protein
MTTLTVEEIKTKFKPIYPEGENWDLTIDFLLKSPAEAIIINDLTEALKVNGAFREPIYVGKAVREDDSEFEAVLNGTHRVATAIISGLQTLEVDFEIEENEEKSESNISENKYYPTIEAKIEFTDLINPSEDEEQFELIFDYLRSFKLDESEWVTADLCSGMKGTFTFFYEGTNGSQKSIQKVSDKIYDIISNNKILKEQYIKHTTILMEDDEED